MVVLEPGKLQKCKTEVDWESQVFKVHFVSPRFVLVQSELTLGTWKELSTSNWKSSLWEITTEAGRVESHNQETCLLDWPEGQGLRCKANLSGSVWWGRAGIVFITFSLKSLELCPIESVFFNCKGNFMKTVFDSYFLILFPLAKHAQYFSFQVFAFLTLCVVIHVLCSHSQH